MLDKISINTQSSICIKSEKIIYVDPFGFDVGSNDADIVFVTHEHRDHFSPADLQKVSKEDTTFVFPASMESEALKYGVKKEKLILLKPEEKCIVDTIPVETVPAYNIGKPMHPKKNQWLGYVITVEDTRIYITGDIDSIPEGKEVNCDIAIVPIGGIFTMNAKQAAEFVNEMKPQIVIPSHYGSIVGKPEDAKKFEKLIDNNITVCIKIL